MLELDYPAPVRRASTLLTVLALGIGAGCGNDGEGGLGKRKRDGPAGRPPSPGTQVELAVRELVAAARRRDVNHICARMLAQRVTQRLQLAGINCQAELRKALPRVFDPALEVLDVDVDVDGSRATARVASEAGGRRREDTLGFIREGGRWRAATLGG